MQGLTNRAIAEAFAGWILVGIGASEGIQDFRINSMGPELGRACSEGNIIDRERDFGNLGDGVGQDFGSQALPIVAGKVPMVGSIRFVGDAGTLVRLRKEDRFEKLFLTEARFAKMASQGIEEFGIGGRIGGSHIIDWVDDTDAEEVSPDPVDRYMGESGVIASDHPIDERLSWIDSLGDGGSTAIQEGGREDLLGQGMFDLTAFLDEDDFLATRDGRGESGPFEANLLKESGEGVEVFLAIDFEGMLVAFGAFQSNAEEELAGDGHKFIWFTAIAEHGDCSMSPGATLSGQEITDPNIVRKVLSKDVAKPLIEAEGRFDTDAIGIGPEQVRPFVSPEVGIFWLAKKMIDELLLALRILVLEEGSAFFGSGRSTDAVEVGSSQKAFGWSGLAWEDVKMLEFLENRVIDKVGAGKVLVGLGGDGIGLRNGGAPRNDFSHVAGHDGGFAGELACAKGTVVIDGDDGGFIGHEGGGMGDIALRAVAVLGEDLQGERFIRLEGARIGEDFQLIENGILW